MRIDLTCPVELRRCQLPSEQYPVCEMQIFNLSDKTVSSIQVCFLCFDGDGEQYARRVERLQTENAVSRQMFSLDAMAQEAVEAAGIEVVFDKVWFEDGTVWRRGSGSPAEFQPTPVLQDQRFAVMQEMAGSDAITYPSDQGSVWVCVCGRPNSAHEDACRRCGRDKHDVFVNFNEAAIEKIIFQRESAQEEAERAERELARKNAEERREMLAHKRRRRRLILTGAITSSVLLILIIGSVFFGYPYIRFNTANRWFENGRYDDAKAVYAEMNDTSFYWKIVYHYGYRLSSEEEPYSYDRMMLECDYRKAAAALRNDTAASLLAARQAFDTEPLRSYKDSSTQAKQAQYQYAQKLTEQKNWEEAIEAWQEICDYADADSRLLQTKYDRAESERSAKEYENAREHFLQILQYADASQKADDCLRSLADVDVKNGNYISAIEKYQLLEQAEDVKRVSFLYAEELLAEKQYESAIEYYRAAQDHYEPGRESAQQQIRVASYKRAEELLEEKNYDEAAAFFEQAGNYSDAARRAKYECRYAPAVALMESGRYMEAAEAFEKLGNYEDSTKKRADCFYLMAEEQYQAGEDEAALELIARIDEHEKAQELRVKCLLRMAETLLAAGDEDGALEKYLQIADVETDTVSVPERIAQLRYKKAIRAMNSKDWGTAAQIFAQIPDYLDSAENLISCRYSLALDGIENGEYDEAIAILSEIENYEKAKEYIKIASYRSAEKKHNAGEHVEAAELFVRADDYSDAKQRYAACMYEQAVILSAEGQYQEAYDLLASIPENEDAHALMLQTGYVLATALEESGELYEAAVRFDALGDYQDAAERAENCRDACYASAYETVGEAMKKKDWHVVIDILEDIDMNALGGKYTSLKSDYQEACYQLANQLFKDKKYYEAYAYYIRIPDYKDTSTKCLNRVCYFIIGKWESSKGVIMEFRADGTCNIDGKEGYYYAPNKYSLHIGDREESRKMAYEITTAPTANGKKMTLKKQGTNNYFYMTRVNEEVNAEE